MPHALVALIDLHEERGGVLSDLNGLRGRALEAEREILGLR